MIRWEYRIVDSDDVPGGGIFRGKSRHNVEEYLNAAGRDGWEIVNIDFLELEGRTSFVGVAKRPME